MKTRYPKSHAGETFIKNQAYQGREKEFELFYVDEVPASTASLVQSIWKETVGKMADDMSPEQLAQLASTCSKELYRNLGWYGMSSVDQFDFIFVPGRQKEIKDKFYDKYLFETPFEKPHNLSQLIESEMLNCNSHAVLIKEAVQDTRVGIYSLFGADRTEKEKPLNHHTLLLQMGNYVVRIDSSVLPRKELIHPNIPKELFYVVKIQDSQRKNKYLPTTFLHK